MTDVTEPKALTQWKEHCWHYALKHCPQELRKETVFLRRTADHLALLMHAQFPKGPRQAVRYGALKMSVCGVALAWLIALVVWALR